MTYDYKQDFPIFQHTNVAYIDNAATAQRPQCVLDAVADFYRCHNANPLRGLYPLSVEATDIYERARETVRDFIGARSAREIVFTRNTTESLNLVAYSYGLTHVKAGDEVLVSIMEHHSDLLPWQMVCRQTGAELKFIECAPDGSVDLQQIESLITERTKIVAMTQVSNVLGRKYPVKEVAAMAHKKGAVMVVDGAQSTPHMPVNVQELGADFFAFSGHKVFGPMGIGVLYGNLAPEGAIVKIAGVPSQLMTYKGKARVFDSLEDGIQALRAGQIHAGDCCVLRFMGLRGRFGTTAFTFQEELKGLHELYNSCAIITDGRFSGGTSGLSIGYVSPEAALGSPLGVIEEGDEVEIDIPARKLHLCISDEEMNRRLAAFHWEFPSKDYPRYLNLFVQNVGSMAKGGIWETK